MRPDHHFVALLWHAVELLAKLALYIALLVVMVKALPPIVTWLFHLDRF